MARRTPETLADYLVVAITPALIGLMVGSLLWFLIEVFYGGDFRTLWVSSFFVLGIVGVSRIAIEEGYHRAQLFGFVLAAALGFVLPPKAWPLLALIWWSVHKLTWDCTVIDDDQDASGEGLLQTMGLDSGGGQSKTPPGTTVTADQLEATTSKEPTAEKYWWDRLFEPDRRPHAPGVWVVYFSLAALPLFGIGGWFVTDPTARAAAFSLLVVYVACGMGLLLATSFLGLRRYLRQRRLQMPMEMTTTWILVGITMVFVTLIVATILPRPRREQSLSAVPSAMRSAFSRVSRFAIGNDGKRDDAAKDVATADAKDNQKTDRQGGNSAGKFDGQAKGSAGANGKGSKSSDGGKSDSGGGSGKGKSGKSSSSDAKGDKSQNQNAEADSNRKSGDSSQKTEQQEQSQSSEKRDQQSGDHQRAEPPKQNSPSSQQFSSRPSFNPVSLLTLLLGAGARWLLYAAIVIGLLFAAWYYREDLQAAWQKLLDELRELWESLFGKKQAASEAAIPMEVTAPPRLFASFRDPFLTGDASRMTWPQLVRYTFEALEAWGGEHECARAAGQTPLEFALALAAVEPQIAAGVQSLAGWYSQIAYAPKAAAGSPDVLRELWTALDRRRAPLMTT
jgi:hypothetical protein